MELHSSGKVIQTIGPYIDREDFDPAAIKKAGNCLAGQEREAAKYCICMLQLVSIALICRPPSPAKPCACGLAAQFFD